MNADDALAQVWLNGVIDRAWVKAAGSVDAFKVEHEARLEEAGYMCETGAVEVVDGRPVMDWPMVYVGRPRRGTCHSCGAQL